MVASDLTLANNLLLQAELHPLVSGVAKTREEFVLSLIHAKPYACAARRAAGLKVLDLGCNDGHGAAVLADRAAEVVGADVSPKAIAAARLAHRARNVRFDTISGIDLPYSEDTFDLVLAFQVIEHVTDVLPYLREIRRVLKPQGTLLLSTPNRMIRLDVGMKPWNEFHVREYSADGLRAALQEVFPETIIRGLTAAPEPYGIEFARCQAALRRARDRVLGSVGQRRPAALRLDPVRIAKSTLPRPAVDVLRRFRDRLRSADPNEDNPPLDQDFIERWSLSDLYYVEEKTEIERSLDLLAECRTGL